jgi:hypothetical protein
MAICLYTGKDLVALCKSLVGIMLPFLLELEITIFVVFEIKTIMEINMKTTIVLMFVVAGIARAGQSGDVFPRLQGESVEGFDSPLAPPELNAIF